MSDVEITEVREAHQFDQMRDDGYDFRRHGQAIAPVQPGSVYISLKVKRELDYDDAHF